MSATLALPLALRKLISKGQSLDRVTGCVAALRGPPKQHNESTDNVMRTSDKFLEIRSKDETAWTGKFKQ